MLSCFHVLNEKNDCQNHEIGRIQFHNIFVGGCGGHISHSKSIQKVKCQMSTCNESKKACFGIKNDFKCYLYAFTFAHSELEDPVCLPCVKLTFIYFFPHCPIFLNQYTLFPFPVF